MKFLRALLPILLAAVSFSPIDYERALTLRVEGLIQQHPVVKSYLYAGNGWFEFTNEDGRTWFRNFGDARTAGGLKPKKIISIDLRKLDTSGYTGMFQEIVDLPFGMVNRPPVGSTISNDGSCEMTAPRYLPQTGASDVRLYKSNSSGTAFQEIMIYPNTFIPFGAVDMDGDGLVDILGDSAGSIIAYEASASGRLDMRVSQYWKGKNGDLQVPRILDLDGDRNPELVFKQFGNGFLGPTIIKYHPQRASLFDVFRMTYPGNPDFRGYWAVGDFDVDGSREFVTATIQGIVCFVEHVAADTSYALVFTDTTRFINSYFHTEGNDLDRDGRPECFIGSDNSNGLNNIAVYEAIGDNTYEVTAWLELYPLGNFEWQTIWTGDVTGDGNDEIVFSCAGVLIVLESTGNDEWRAIWYKLFGASFVHRLFDVDRDGVLEILLSMEDRYLHHTKVLKYRRIINVDDPPNSNSRLSIKVYPQPADDDLRVSLCIPGTDDLRMLLYNSVAELFEVRDLYRDEASCFRTDLRTDRLPEGVYYIEIIGKHFHKTSKIVILH